MSIFRALERFLLPNACVACERPVDEPAADALVCSHCRWRMRPVVGGCPRCAQPLPPVGPCRFCRELPEALRWIRSGVWLDDETREVVHHLKYEGYAALAPFAAALIARVTVRPMSGTLIPIPMARARERKRGYNQAAVIAEALGALWGLPVASRILERARAAGSQTVLTPLARKQNIAGAFTATAAPGTRSMPPMPSLPSLPSLPSGGSGRSGDAVAVIIVDDVLTTGATIIAAATALEAAGWTEIGAVTFARALPVERRVEQGRPPPVATDGAR